MDKDYFGVVGTSKFGAKVPVVGLGEYRKDKGSHDFSRKQVWFYVYGEDDIEKEFKNKLTSLINSRFIEDDIDWDLMTLYPTHAENEVNSNMKSLIESISNNTGIKYKQVLNRNRKIKENHELDSKSAKEFNLKGSIDVKAFDEKNVVLIDNIALSGLSLAHGASKLKEAGAENVFGVVLGLAEDFPGKSSKDRDKVASNLMADI